MISGYKRHCSHIGNEYPQYKAYPFNDDIGILTALKIQISGINTKSIWAHSGNHLLIIDLNKEF
jgi:hypothetical protein